jgi:isopenicillin N synthase-like dioxygenase
VGPENSQPSEEDGKKVQPLCRPYVIWQYLYALLRLSALFANASRGLQLPSLYQTRSHTGLYEMTSFTRIPVIDLALADDHRTRPTLLVDLHHAITEVGFLYISNHGVSADVTNSVKSILPRLFALSPTAKHQVALENSPHFLGYSGVGTETTDGAADSREQFEFGTELKATWQPGAPYSERLRGPNQVSYSAEVKQVTDSSKWPEELPEARPVVEAYMNALSDLGIQFLELVAQALALPQDAFLSFLSDQHRLKLVRYPGLLPEQLRSGNQGVGLHKDSSGWWTFLLQASAPEVKGLQVLNKLGQWIDVPNIPETFVVNIGQAFEVVTNGVCKATTHRVLSSEHERYSVPFFQGVRRDLTKSDAVGTFASHFNSSEEGSESYEGRQIDSAFLRGKYNTWGESQLRTKIRSHRENGRKFYPEVYGQYINDQV